MFRLLGFLDRKKRIKDKITSEYNNNSISDLSQTTGVKKKAKAHDPSFSTWHLGNMPNSGIARYGRLSYRELEEIYFQSSVIRAIIDGITRVISSLDWRIVSVSEDREIDRDVFEGVRAFFMNPNANDESFSTIIRKIVRDLLIYDAGVIEKVMTGDDNLVEIYARDGSTFEIKIDTHGLVKGYVQKVYSPSERSVNFEPDEIIYLSLYPRTSSPYGSPPIDALVNEISAAMFASQLIARSFECDEIPPGILNLGKIGQVAYERAREYFKEKRTAGRRNFELTILHDSDRVEWIPLTRPPQELQLSELIDKVNRMIFRCFGVTPTEMGSIEDINRATAAVQENISRSKLIVPIVRLLEEYINNEIIWSHISGDIRINFSKPKEDDPEHTLKVCSMFERGLLTVNEARKRLGEKGIKGGDRAFIIMSERVLFIDELSKQDDLRCTPKGSDIVTKSYDIQEGLLSDFMKIHDKTGKWLIKELSSAYLKGKRTDEIIDRACAQLFGRMRNAIHTHKFENAGSINSSPNIIEQLIRNNYLSPVESTLKSALAKFARSKGGSRSGLLKVLEKAYVDCRKKLEGLV